MSESTTGQLTWATNSNALRLDDLAPSPVRRARKHFMALWPHLNHVRFLDPHSEECTSIQTFISFAAFCTSSTSSWRQGIRGHQRSSVVPITNLTALTDSCSCSYGLLLYLARVYWTQECVQCVLVVTRCGALSMKPKFVSLKLQPKCSDENCLPSPGLRE